VLGLGQAAALPVGYRQEPADLAVLCPVILGEMSEGLVPEYAHLFGLAAPPREVGARQCDRRGQVGHDAGSPADRRLVRLIAVGRERRLGTVEQWLGLVRAARKQRPYRPREAQPGPGADELRGQRPQPPVDRRLLVPPQQFVEMLLDQPRGPGGIAGGHSMPHCTVDQPVILPPRGRRLVEPGHLTGALPQQAGVQQVGEELVVTPPATHLIQRDQEQVGLLRLLQQLLTVGTAGDRVTQRPRQPLQHRGLQQEGAHRPGLPVQHLLGQVVQHMTVTARERRHKADRVRMTPQREGGQLEPSHPTLGAALQRRHRGLGHLWPGGLPQQRGRLLRGEAQVLFAQLAKLATGPQPRQRQGRVGAAGQHQPQRTRQVLQQQPERAVDRRRLDQVVVVQHQHHLLARVGQIVDQGGHHRLERGGLHVLEQRGDASGDPRVRAIQRGTDVPPEPHRVIVASVERQPADGPLAAPGPVGHQARLAEAGRGAQQDQVPPHVFGQALQQPRPRREPRPQARHAELGRQQHITRGPSGPGRDGHGRFSHR
jgi:hypothetical protein